MNRIIKLFQWLAIAGAGAGMLSCEHDYMVYDQARQDGIYMNVGTDSSLVLFQSNITDSSTWNLAVIVLGMPSDRDRSFKVVVVDSLTSAIPGIHYNIDDELVIKTGEVKGCIPLVFYRFRDPELITRSVGLKLRLVANDDFVPVMWSDMYITIEDEPTSRPGWWKNELFGPYTPELLTVYFQYYWRLKDTDPYVYGKIEEICGENMDHVPFHPWFGVYLLPEMWIMKYILVPMYEDGIDVPKPLI